MTQTLLKEPLTRGFINMKDAIQDALRLGFKYFRGAGVIDYKVRIVKSDPQGPAECPAIAINRTSDGETNQSLGDLFGYVRDPDIDATIKKFGTDFMESLELRIWSTNSDQRDLLYALTKAILFNYRHYLAVKWGLVNQAITGGRDEANHVQYKGHFMYWGVVMFRAENAIQRNIICPSITEVESSMTVVPGVVGRSMSDTVLPMTLQVDLSEI